MISALPVSGAAVPNTFGAQLEPPRISLISAELELPVALSAEFGSEMGRPQLAVLDLLLQRADVDPEVALERVVRPLRVQQVERFDLLVAEHTHVMDHMLGVMATSA